MARRAYDNEGWSRYGSGPIRRDDGIQAKSQHGKFVENWWADRWIEALKALMDSRRLGRGRSYARRGQVVEIDVGAGEVFAQVQGSRLDPYKVEIQLRPLNDRQWAAVFDALAEQALFSAQLLNGEMPVEVEEVFLAAGVSLFPVSRGDLQTDCTCPDWANPCKHIAAVYYLLGERFDEDPFLLFQLRGRSQNEVEAGLRERRSAGLEVVAEEPALYVTDQIEPVEVLSLEESLDAYWDAGFSAADVTLEPEAPKVALALLKRLGVPDFISRDTFEAQIERVYDGVTKRALEVAYGEGLGN